VGDYIMKPPNTINTAAGKYGAFLRSKIVVFMLLSSVKHEGFGWNSCHIEINGKNYWLWAKISSSVL